ncbi:MAG: TonB-dependent receptor domain-containing protein [Rhodospirillaceae bacterium]
MFRCSIGSHLLHSVILVLILLILYSTNAVQAQRAGENAVAEAEDAFGTVVGSEEIGLYSSTSARGFSPSKAGNMRINGLYFDQAAAPNVRIRRGSTIHVGISAQGYPLPAPTGVVDLRLRVPGDRYVTSLVAKEGALGSYMRHNAEIDAQIPIIQGVLSIGAGLGYSRNNAHQFALGDEGYNGGLVAHWRPNTNVSIIPFISYSKTSAVGGDRPRAFIGDNEPPDFRAEDLTSPDWLFFGFRQYNYGLTSAIDLPDQWKLKVGLFRSENNTPLSFTAFILNTDSQGLGDYAISQSPRRYTHSTSGELRLSRSLIENTRRHTFYITARARDRESTFGGGDLKFLGPVRMGAFPDLAQPSFQVGAPTLTQTDQITGGVAYEGVWQNVGQLSVALQKSDYKRIRKRPDASPITGSTAPWLYNVGAAAYISKKLAIYASYTRGFEELGSAPGNAVNRDEAVPAALSRQIDAGIRYQVRDNLQFVAGVFQINKPYYALDQLRLFRQLGDIRHRGVELSLAGTITKSLTVVAGTVLLQPRIISSSVTAGPTNLTAVGPIPRLARVNLQYQPAAIKGLALDAKVESISSRYLNVTNTRRLSGVITFDAGLRYTTTVSDIPVRLRLQGRNLTNVNGITPDISGQIRPFEMRRIELSITADF